MLMSLLAFVALVKRRTSEQASATCSGCTRWREPTAADRFGDAMTIGRHRILSAALLFLPAVLQRVMLTDQQRNQAKRILPLLVPAVASNTARWRGCSLYHRVDSMKSPGFGGRCSVIASACASSLPAHLGGTDHGSSQQVHQRRSGSLGRPAPVDYRCRICPASVGDAEVRMVPLVSPISSVAKCAHRDLAGRERCWRVRLHLRAWSDPARRWCRADALVLGDDHLDEERAMMRYQWASHDLDAVWNFTRRRRKSASSQAYQRGRARSKLTARFTGADVGIVRHHTISQEGAVCTLMP